MEEVKACRFMVQGILQKVIRSLFVVFLRFHKVSLSFGPTFSKTFLASTPLKFVCFSGNNGSIISTNNFLLSGTEKTHNELMSRVFLLRQLWFVNYYVKSSSNDLSNENIKTGVSREIIFQKTFCLEDNRNTSGYVFITEIIWRTFDGIIDDP